ncbi:MAG: 3-phosphoserine/phosphohydroxythreonine transaminase [Spirochaetales bacterium]|jgi:phosphoserine aminotransferase|nr:3-phosphoserine/phosphohydroxythreonine transaminase [Spirochaetales bacterium]
MSRKKNFFAGPSVLPLEVLQQMEAEIADYNGAGLSIVESSHRSEPFNTMYEETLALVGEVMEVPEGYSVFFLGGGASLQFAMLPLNFLNPQKGATYINSGSWANKALQEARSIGPVEVYYDGKENNYTTLPAVETVKPAPESSYLYLCSNETIGGVQWKEWPECGVPLVADMSSDILSRPLQVEKFSLLFAGAQKNMGPAGATLIIIKDEFLEQQNSNLPPMLDYRSHQKSKGLYNTPPVFSIWGVKLVLEWVKRNGGTTGMAQRAALKSSLLYDVIDASGGYYRSPVDKNYRSTMNIVFRLPSEELEAKFLAATKEAGMVGLKGHRSVGGLRASLYNALPVEDVEALATLMQEFQRENG